MKKQRKHYTPEEKVAILRRHLVEGVQVGGIHATFQNFRSLRGDTSREARAVAKTKQGAELVRRRVGNNLWSCSAAQPLDVLRLRL